MRPLTDRAPSKETAAVAPEDPVRRELGRAPLPLRPLLSAILIVVLLGPLVTAATIAQPAIRAAMRPTAAIPDDLLLIGSPRGAQASLFLPTTQTRRLLIEGAGAPAPSPDGRQLLFTQTSVDSGGQSENVVAFDSRSLRRLWSAQIASQPVIGGKDHVPFLNSALAVAGDRVYVASQPWQSSPPLSVVALDLASGRKAASWKVDLGGYKVNDTRIVGAPDGKHLYLLVTFAPGSAGADLYTAYYRLHLPDGKLELRRYPIRQAGSATVSFFSGRWLTPDGAALYGLSYQPGTNGQALEVEFFDLSIGAALPVLDLPFREQTDLLPREQAVSPDGRRLYVLAPTLGQLAIVDLTKRRLERLVTLDVGAVKAARSQPSVSGAWVAVRGLFLQEAEAKVSFPGEMQLSPDGCRLYAVGAFGAGSSAQAHGIWVIDTARWRVTADWLPDTPISAIMLGGGGRELYAQQGYQMGDADSGTLRALDTFTGSEHFVLGGLSRTTVYSLLEIYRTTYGRSPAVSGPSPPTS